MSDLEPSPERVRSYSRPAIAALVLDALAIVPSGFSFWFLAAHNHVGGMASMGVAVVSMITLVAGVGLALVGALVASGARWWRGPGEKRAGLVCLGTALGVAAAAFLSLAAAG